MGTQGGLFALVRMTSRNYAGNLRNTTLGVRHEPAQQRLQNFFSLLQGSLKVAIIGVPDFPKQSAMAHLKNLEQYLSLLIAECQRKGSFGHNHLPTFPVDILLLVWAAIQGSSQAHSARPGSRLKWRSIASLTCRRGQVVFEHDPVAMRNADHGSTMSSPFIPR